MGDISNHMDKKRSLSNKPVMAVGAEATVVLGSSSLTKLFPTSTFMKVITFKAPVSLKLFLTQTQKAMVIALGKTQVFARGLATSGSNTSILKAVTSAEKIQHATQTVVFSQLEINGKNQGVHAFICQIRDVDDKICPNILIADCGHKIGFDNVRIPKENLLNSIVDVSRDGEYLSAIKDPDQIGLSIAIRYALSRRAFSITPNGPEILLLDYPIHQQRLLPLLAKTYTMSSAANYMKMLYVNRTPQSNKTIHVILSAFKATFIWHNQRTLQECRGACGGQGLKTENHVCHLKSEFDVQSTFEGDNNVLMQQVNVYGHLSHKL
ncbi:acyl-coenzyme A oxidase 3, peroxisomal-like [Pistacia vera]|uniref:acyl-coenzyme A oxidase 3, peroxisomal-like n=1 Tax=Pistacia vera TaxID=55513 RepID=UPI001262ED99|nr:acyl-coenzyme A oxidase 3, peroxisomal-like [Pistacia vera]